MLFRSTARRRRTDRERRIGSTIAVPSMHRCGSSVTLVSKRKRRSRHRTRSSGRPCGLRSSGQVVSSVPRHHQGHPPRRGTSCPLLVPGLPDDARADDPTELHSAVHRTRRCAFRPDATRTRRSTSSVGLLVGDSTHHVVDRDDDRHAIVSFLRLAIARCITLDRTADFVRVGLVRHEACNALEGDPSPAVDL